MKKELYIMGAGSVAGHVASNLKGYSDDFVIAGFFDDDPQKVGTLQFGTEVLGTVSDALRLDNANIVIGIAFPQIKRTIIELLSANSTLQYPTLVHEKAWISNNVSLGKGCIIYPGTTINFGSKIDDFVCINMNCSLGHHTQVGSYSSFAPGVNTGGHTQLAKGVDMGIGASTLQKIHVGENSIIGGQAMVTKNISSDSTAVGVPAKVMSKSSATLPGTQV